MDRPSPRTPSREVVPLAQEILTAITAAVSLHTTSGHEDQLTTAEKCQRVRTATGKIACSYCYRPFKKL